MFGIRWNRATVVEESAGLIIGQDDSVGVHVRHASKLVDTGKRGKASRLAHWRCGDWLDRGDKGRSRPNWARHQVAYRLKSQACAFARCS